ncbi:MAG: hypothetical protein ACRD1P_12280 [Thermoanaerobaculia bacterium]
MSLSVYIHVGTVWLFGKSVFVVRATSVAVTLLGAIGAALALRTGLRNRFWWAAPLVLAVMPVFFLHSRLAFESAMMASFFACFVWTYLLYRFRSPGYIFAALFFGAATFYAYTAGQGVMLVSGLLLFVSDLRYHLRQRRPLLLGAVLFAVLLAAPYIRYRVLHPGVVREQLVVLNSYWTHPIPLGKKLALFDRNYFAGFRTSYWFWPSDAEFIRHRMKGMAYVPLSFLPFVLLGVLVCLWNFGRSSVHRAVLLTLFGVPFAGAAAEIQILRLLAMVVPVTLLALVGIDQLYHWARRVVPFHLTALACAGSLSIATANLTQTALVDGPTWYSDYGLYGMQYGAQQVVEVIREELARGPDTHVYLADDWANNPETFLDFFFGADQRKRVSMGGLGNYLLLQTPLRSRDLFVMTPQNYQSATRDPKFVVSRPERTVRYPDGRTGFYFVRMRYSDNARAVLAAEREARKRLVEETISLSGEAVRIHHSPLDMGALPALFDGQFNTLIRGLEANPFVMVMTFPTPRKIGKVTVTLGSHRVIQLRFRVSPADGSAERAYDSVYRNPPPDPRLEFVFPDGPLLTKEIRMEIGDLTEAETMHVHIRELSFQ